MTPEELWDREYQRWLARMAKQRARRRWRYANEPGYAERERAYNRAYYLSRHQELREKHRAYNREWQQRRRTDPDYQERERVYAREYASRLKERGESFWNERRERQRAYQRTYRAAHRDDLRAYKREWMRRYRAGSTTSPAKAPPSVSAEGSTG